MATENPYASPTTEATLETPSEDREHLRKIAVAQRHTNFAVLFYLCLIPLSMVLSNATEGAQWGDIVLGLVAIAVIIYGAVSVYSLASQFRGRIVAVIYVIALLIPLLGLILLILISSKATKLLQKNGIKVGLLGANPNTI